MREETLLFARDQPDSMPGMVQALLRQHCQLWWDCEKVFPSFKQSFSQTGQWYSRNGCAITGLHLPGMS
jgi:hypothetical protein